MKAFHGLLLVGGLAFAGGGCVTARPVVAVVPRMPIFSRTDGLTCETRVVVHARTEPGGLAAEADWLYANYPGYEVKDEALGQCGEATAEIVSIRTADGRTVEIHFDISSFYEPA